MINSLTRTSQASAMGNQWSQLFPPAPVFTEAQLPDLSGKVFVVTGSSAGVGKELTRLLYSHNGTVYLANRSAEKTDAVITWVKEQHPDAKGVLHYLHLHLDDLEGIKASAETFLAKEQRLDVLFNNAGVMTPPKGSKTKQGYELQLGTNCVAPFLFTKLLTPRLLETARAIGEKGRVRVVWVSSSAAHLGAPKNGLDIGNLHYEKDCMQQTKYAVSKAGNILHAMEFGRRYGLEGLTSVAINPGNLRTELSRHMPAWQFRLFGWILHAPVYGAYTELYAGLSPDVVGIKKQEWIIPWGRIALMRKDFGSEQGAENAKAFWEWCEGEVERFT
ncbi:Oxidoreductase short-chain dehydrogenase [Pyrenophora seminiperda CCB06]|uniref:Oxidoreductase short-chain dehydrogenase n=1 Tax=Pyrenophora seminiperda CCB06 TaxID=1302712 RepID=A0A3M7M5V0_9PLEO|nr:Oxidoreductase short-chain dehydrogenase [Pyrenophora seminiperda CCB06]